MGQSNRSGAPCYHVGLVVSALLLLVIGCKGRDGSSPKRPATEPKVASLVPAATDLIIGMGAADHLVAVSNYDLERPETSGLPRVGDYATFDWEQISALRPSVMIVFMMPDRMPEGLRQRADQLQIRLVNVRTERLEDVFAEIGNLGRILGERKKAEVLSAKLKSQLDAVRKRGAGRPRPRVLLVRDKECHGVVGRDNFLHDLLEIAGGENVITASGWPSIDREKLLALDPDVIIQLLPGAADHIVAEARRTWQALPELSATKADRIHILTEWYTQQPGSRIGDLAEKFAELLHPAASSLSLRNRTGMKVAGHRGAPLSIAQIVARASRPCPLSGHQHDARAALAGQVLFIGGGA